MRATKIVGPVPPAGLTNHVFVSLLLFWHFHNSSSIYHAPFRCRSIKRHLRVFAINLRRRYAFRAQMLRSNKNEYRKSRPSGNLGTGLARALSKLGFCSRSQAWDLIKAGRVQVNGVLVRDPERRTYPGRENIHVDGQPVRSTAKIYLMLNKPRGLITSASDEQGRETVFDCLQGYPFVSPVGRLDKASEGLLLFTNDTQWAARITNPATHLDKTYHAQINSLPTPDLLGALGGGTMSDGELLKSKQARVLREGIKNCWLEVVLDEGKNRHIRRLLEALNVEVLRLVRVQIGRLSLGNLGKGQVRELNASEVREIF